jgi:hypothetical protein
MHAQIAVKGDVMSLYYSNLLKRRVRGVKLLGVWVPLSRA